MQSINEIQVIVDSVNGTLSVYRGDPNMHATYDVLFNYDSYRLRRPTLRLALYAP